MNRDTLQVTLLYQLRSQEELERICQELEQQSRLQDVQPLVTAPEMLLSKKENGLHKEECETGESVATGNLNGKCDEHTTVGETPSDDPKASMGKEASMAVAASRRQPDAQRSRTLQWRSPWNSGRT